MRDFIVHPEETEAQTPTIPQQDFSQKQSADDTQPPRLHGILGQTQDAAEQALEERAENNERYRISVDDETYKQFNKIIANSDNPEETAYKIGTAQKYAEMLDMPLVDAYANLDTLNREYWGEHTTAKGAFKSVVDMLTVGKNNVKIGNLGNKLVDAEKRGDTELVEKLLAEIEAVENESAAYMDNGTPRAWITSTLQAGAQSLPYTGAGVGAAMFGAFIGGAGGALAAGFGASTYLARGQEYVEMRKKGIRPEIARNVSLVDGAIQGGIETALDFTLGVVGKNISKATKGLRGNITSAVSEKISNTIAKKIHFGSGLKIATNWLVHGTMNTASEGAEEFLQQTTGDVSQNVAISAENKARAEELKQALSTLEGEYSEALEDELKKAYPQLEEMTLKEIVKDSANAFVEGAKGALALGIFNAGLSGTMRSAKLKSAKGFIDPYGNVEEYLQIRKMSENVKSEEMFSNAVKDSAVFEGMNDEQKAKIVKQIFAEGQARAAEAEAKTRADIEESKDTADNAEASPVDETGERAGKAREYRTETGGLYTEEDTQRRADADDDGKAHGRLLLGDPTRQSLLKDDGNRYGYINYTVDGDNVTIDDFKMTAGREKLSREFFEDFAEKFAGKNIEWNPKHETNIKLKNEIIQNNPNGKGAGLNYFTADTIEDNRARIQIAKTIRENTKNWSDEQVSAGTALLTSAARAKGVKLADFVNNYFHNGQVITNKESDVSNIAQAAAQHGATMENVFGATQLDKAGRAIIYIGEHGDFNTFSHELGHFFRKTCLDGETLASAEREFGVDQNTHQWTTAQEEAFADGFTDYLRTGKARTKGLESLYKKIAEFIADVFRGLQGQIKLNDNIKAVYDSLLEDDGSGLARARKAVESAKAQEIAEKRAAKEQAQKESEQKKAEEEAKKTDAEKASEKAERVIADYSATTAEKAQAALESATENARAVMSEKEKKAEAERQLEKAGLSKNKRNQIVYNSYNALTEEQKEAVKNELLSRDYSEIADGIFAESSRRQELKKEDFEKEFKDCQILRKMGAEKVYMLPQHYSARIDGTTGNCADTICYFNGKEAFVELKNLNKSNISSLKWEYRKSLKQAPNAFIVYDNEISNDEIKRAINGEVCAKLRKDADFTGTVYVYKSVNDEIVKIDIKKHALEMTSSAVGWANSESFNETTREPLNSFTDKILAQQNSVVNNFVEENELLFQLVGKRGFSNLMQHFSHIAGTSHDVKERTFANNLKNNLLQFGVMKQNGELNQSTKYAENGRINVNLFSFSKQGDALLKAFSTGNALKGLDEKAKEKIFAIGGIKRTENGQYHIELPLQKLLLESDGKENETGKYLFTAYPELKNVTVQFGHLQGLKKDISSIGVLSYLSEHNKIVVTLENKEYSDAEKAQVISMAKEQISKQIDAIIQNIEADAEKREAFIDYVKQSKNLIAGLLEKRPDLNPQEIREQLKTNAIYKEAVKAAKNEYSAPVLFQISKETKQNIDDVITAANSGNNEKFERTLGSVTPKLAEIAKAHGYNIDGYSHSLDNYFINHQRKQHGDAKKEANRGQIAITDDDIRNIPNVLANPDFIIYGSKVKNGNPAITFVQNQENATVFVEEVRTGKKRLSAQTIYKTARTFDVSSIKDARELYAQSDPSTISIVDVKNEIVNSERRESPLFQIIGEMGAANLDASEEEKEGKTRLENLAIAKQMQKEGKDAKTIRLATGWEKGARKWRYEINDDVKPFNDDYTPRRFIDDSEYERLNKKFNDAIEQGMFPPLPSAEQELFDSYNDAENEFIGKYIEYDNVGNASWKAAVPFDHVIKAPELFRAYPELKKIQFTIDPTLPRGVHGATIGDIDGNITIALANARLGKSTLLHEIQHAIQNIEGFATGSNRSDFSEKGGLSAYEQYRRTAGEVEARNVQKRLDMTAEERLATLLAETEDVAKKDQIILDKATAAYCQSIENAEKIGEINGVEVFDRLPDGYKIDTTAHAPAGYIYAHNGKSRFSGQRKAVYVVKPEPQIESVRKQYEGTAQWLKAPNGNDTNLTEKQWLQVRTPAFKEFFGDWENDPKHASKIVDENGEPKVCYHVTSENFDTFDIDKARANSDIQAFFFSSDTQDWGDMGENTLGVFLNMRNPSKKPYVKQSENNAGIKAREELQAKGFDGTIEAEDGLETEYAVFNANQIKSATDNNGDFDSTNNSILFQVVTEEDLKKRIESVKHTPQRADYIKRYYSDIKEQYEEKEVETPSGKARIEIAKEKDENDKRTKKELDALVQFAKLGYYPTLLSESMKIGEERHIDALLNHNVLLEIKHPTGNANGIAKEIKDGINKDNSEIISVFLIDNADISDESITECLNKKLSYLHGTTDGVFIFRNGKLSEIKIPRVESLQTRSLGNSNSSTLFQFVNNEEELFNEAKKYKTWEEFRDAQETEDTTSHYKAADIEEPVDIEQFAKESEAVLNAKSEELQRLDSEIADLEARAEIYGDAFLDAEYLQELQDERRVLEADIAGNFNFGDMEKNAELWLSDTDARNAFYKTIWESAKEAAEKEEYSDENRKAAYIQAGGDETEAAESEKDRQFYDFISKDEYALSQFLKEVAFIAKEANREITDDNRPSDEEELAMYEEKQRLLDRYDKELRHGAFRYVVSQALKSLDNSKKVELTERQRKTILTLIKNNKRDYRDIYADFMNESDWSVEEGYRAGDKLAVRIMSPDFNAEDYTPEERKRIADKLDFKDLKRELKNGSMRMELETVQKLANGFENEIEEIREEKKALEKKIEDNAEASADETRRLKYLHEKELEKIDKRDQAREVQKLKVKLLKSITRKVRFDAVNYEEGQKIIAIQQLFTPQLKNFVDSFLNSEEPYLRDALSQYKTSYDYRRRLQALAQRTGGGSGIRKMIKIFDTKPFEKWTEEDKRIVARYLPRTDWIKELDLEELTKRNKSVLRFDLQSEETQKLLADLLPPDLLSLVTNEKMKDWTLDDVEELAELVDDLRREGREKLRQKKEVEIARAEKLRDRIEREILSNGLHIDEDDTPEEKERKQKAIEKFKKEKLPKILGIGAATKGTLKASQEKQSAFKRLLHGYGDMNMKRFARMLDNGESGINTTLLVDQENDCFNKEHSAIFERSSKIEQVLKDNGLKVEDLSKIVEVDFGGEKQEYTIDELLYFRAASKDEKSRYAVMCGNMFDETIKAAYRQTPEKQQAYLRMCKVKFKNVLNAAEKVLDDNPALADFANAIAEDYSEQYGRMNEICIKEFNTPMGRVDCYVPLVRLESNGDTNENKIKADMLGATGSTANNNVDDGMRKQRVDISPANQKPVEVGLYKTWCKSLNRTEHFIAYAPYIRELHRVYTGRDGAKMRQYIENRYGQGALQYIKDYINEVANPDVSSSLSELDRVVRALRGKTAPAYLGWKISGIIKQVCTSPFPFMQYATPAEYGRAVFDFLRHKEMGEAIKAKSAYMNSRVFDPMIDLLKEQEEKETKPLFAKYDAFLKMGMQGLEAVDWYCVAPGWLAVYRKELQKLNSAEAKQARYDRAYKAEIAEAKAQYGDLASLGDMQLQIEADARAAAEAERDISEDEIEKRAVAKADEITRMCQPSARLADLSPLFKERGKGSELSRAFLQFTTSLNVIWQNLRYDLPNALKRKQWKQAIGTLTGYVLAGVLVGMVSEGLPEPTGDDDKDKEKRLRKIAYYSITQFTDSIPILGNIATNTAERLVAGENKYQGNSDLFPIISKIQNGLYAAEREDYLKALSNFGYAAGLAAGVPVSELKEAGYTVGIGDGDGKLQPHPTAILGRRPKAEKEKK